MIRIGVIGYGYWGRNLVRNCYEASGAQVACVSDLRAPRDRSLPYCIGEHEPMTADATGLRVVKILQAA